MIESVIPEISARQSSPRRTPLDDAQSGASFSYALAAATLERRAASALEVHGATPQTGAAQTPQAAKTDAAPGEARPQSSRPESKDENTAARTSDAPPQKAPNRPAANAAPAATPSSVPVQAGVAAPTVAQVAGAVKTTAGAAIRDLAAPKAKTELSAETAKTPAQQQAAATVKSEFAEILARRLEKTSIFDLRLDPDGLGRVEGRLTIDDAGKSVLALTFDNQNAFDLFARDETALRAALHQAGLTFDSGDFSFRTRMAKTSVEASGGATPQTLAAAYEPSFFASWSAGALDIRI